VPFAAGVPACSYQKFGTPDFGRGASLTFGRFAARAVAHARMTAFAMQSELDAIMDCRMGHRFSSL
jgi:hypothetical protein